MCGFLLHYLQLWELEEIICDEGRVYVYVIGIAQISKFYSVCIFCVSVCVCQRTKLIVFRVRSYFNFFQFFLTNIFQQTKCSLEFITAKFKVVD